MAAMLGASTMRPASVAWRGFFNFPEQKLNIWKHLEK
jgi:hypothetical protein